MDSGLMSRRSKLENRGVTIQMSHSSRLRRFSVVVLSTSLMCPMPASSNQHVPANIISQIPPHGTKCSFPIGTPPSAACIALGKQIFENETFGGNGRTCATCHPASNNFTIDVPYISKLPKSDPLFVFETNRNLAGLETPLLRSNALICENLDGFSNACVLRSVPHTLGLRVTTSPDPGRSTQLRASRHLDPPFRWRVLSAGVAMAHPETAACVILRLAECSNTSRRP